MLGVNTSTHCVGCSGCSDYESSINRFRLHESFESHELVPPGVAPQLLQYLSLPIKLASQLRRELLMEGGGYKKTVMPLLLYQNQKAAVTMATDRCPDLHAAWKTLPE